MAPRVIYHKVYVCLLRIIHIDEGTEQVSAISKQCQLLIKRSSHFVRTENNHLFIDLRTNEKERKCIILPENVSLKIIICCTILYAGALK